MLRLSVDLKAAERIFVMKDFFDEDIFDEKIQYNNTENFGEPDMSSQLCESLTSVSDTEPKDEPSKEIFLQTWDSASEEKADDPTNESGMFFDEDEVSKEPEQEDEPYSDYAEDGDFEYEYDERYFAEEETPAYKHPELFENKSAESGNINVKKPSADAASKPAAHKSSPHSVQKRSSALEGKIVLDKKTVLTAAAAAAAALVIAKFIGSGNNKDR